MIVKTQNSILYLLILSATAFGSTLAQYHQKIQEAAGLVSSLDNSDETLSDAEKIDEHRGIFDKIRSRLPINENVELKDSSFEVSHQWLYERLKQLEAEPVRSAKYGEIVDEISSRFQSLESKLDELGRQEIAERTKDENKKKLDEILKRKEFQPPPERAETWFQRKWREFWEWYESLAPKPKPEASDLEGSPAMASGLLYVVLAIAVALVLFLLYRFTPSLLEQIRNRDKKDDGTRIILGDTLGMEDTSRSIFAEAENLARTGNLRAAIRKGYIAVLCELSDKKIIGLARHKTNRDYLQDVRKREELHKNMTTLTTNFERNWYGANQTDQAEWEEFKQTYQQTMGLR